MIAPLFSSDELYSIAVRVFKNDVTKGFWKFSDDIAVISDDVYEEKVFLVVSELCEAFECWRKNEDITTITWDKDKPLGFPIEMADAYLRVLILLHALGERPRLHGPYPQTKHVEPAWHFTRILRTLINNDLSYVLWQLEVASRDLGVPLKEAIEVKMAYNETRSYRHGGKRA